MQVLSSNLIVPADAFYHSYLFSVSGASKRSVDWQTV